MTDENFGKAPKRFFVMKSKIIHTLKQCKFGLKVIILLFIYIQKMNYKNIFPFFAVVAALAFSACSDGKSYADLLNDENKYVNSFLVIKL